MDRTDAGTEHTLRDIVIVGSGGLAREVAWLIESINRPRPTWNLLGFIGTTSEVGRSCGRVQVIGDDTYLERCNRELSVVIGIGRPATIARLQWHINRLPHLSFPNLVHPSVQWDSDRVQRGLGNIICAGAILTTDIRLGSFNVLNLGSTFGHDIIIGDHCVINPGANLAGRVRLGNGCLLGANCTVLENVSIGDGATVGASSLVVRDVPSRVTVFGVPAKLLPRKE